MTIGIESTIRFNDMFDFPQTVERAKPCNYKDCPIKSLLALNTSIKGNEACRSTKARTGTKVVKANRFAHATGNVVKHRDMCGIDVDKLLSTMPSYIKKHFKV